MRLVSDRNDVRSAVDDLLQKPPATPPELFLRLIALDHAVAYAELVRRLVDTDLDQERQIMVVQWLIELVADEPPRILIDAVTDSARPIEKRVLAFIVLTTIQTDEIPDAVRSLPREEIGKLIGAAVGWLAQADRKNVRLRRSRRSARAKRVCRMKVTLRDTRPPVWRRFEVTDDITFARLHQVLQRVMGWTDSHLHTFHVAGEEISVPDPEWGREVENEKSVRLRDVIDEGVKRFGYDYDFGDNWEHAIVIEKVFEPEAGVRYPRCVAGKRACPPEDCGGVYGYKELIATLADPDHEEYEEMREWAGEWEPERFDLDTVNRRVRAGSR